MRTIIFALTIPVFLSAWLAIVIAQPPDEAGEKYETTVLNDRPIAYWRFEDERFEVHPQSAGHGVIGRSTPSRLYDEDNLNDASAETKGFVRANQAGPRWPRFLAFDSANEAAFFEPPAVIKLADPKADGDSTTSLLDFNNGDSITLEAWVLVKKLGDGQQMYVVGKGRTKNAGFADENQNYALRLAGKKGGEACVTWLFRSAGDADKSVKSEYHRWISKNGFDIDTGWHHIATTYTFGKPESVRGYIDGKSVEGVWDMGGPTTAAPVVDDDELWIGSALGMSAGNSFHGSLDEVAIYRTALPPERIAARWRVLQPKPYITTLDPPGDGVLVEILEGIPDKLSWDFVAPEPSERFTEPGFALVEVPHKYSPLGVRADRSNPFVIRVTGDLELPAGTSRLLIRSRSASRLFVDGKLLVQNPFPAFRGDGHSDVWDVDRRPAAGNRALQPGDQDAVAKFESIGSRQRLTWEIFVGGKNVRTELGETLVAIARPESDSFAVLHQTRPFPLTDDAWLEFVDSRRSEMVAINQQRRRDASGEWSAFWDRRHELARKLVAPPSGGTIEELTNIKPDRPNAEHGTADDWAFLRRVCLDTIGTIPTSEHLRFFFEQPEMERRAKLIDRLLAEPDWADHWVGYWQDVLAENPNILNPTLNNTGPFRWWLHESFLDNKPFDQFATELILMDGSVRYGGAAGFSVASQNDVPMAAKAHVIGQAFLGLEMKCARCHDAPYHDFLQRDLFSVAAMLKREPEKVPKTSSVNTAILSAQGREPLVKVTLPPGQPVPAAWPFEELVAAVPNELLRNPKDSRERLAAFVTAPTNRRFAQVIVNRVWHRLFGWGFVEPVDDWEKATPREPELLERLEREFVSHGYDLKHLTRVILNSHRYQDRNVAESLRDSDSNSGHGVTGRRLRRLTAEQLIDSLFVAAGKRFHVEELNIDVDGGRKQDVSITLGPPRRAWQFTSMSNERDRPSLSLPAAQTIVDVLEAFGWRPSRPDPITVRSRETTVMQPAMLLNGIVAKRVTQLSDDSAFTELALTTKSPEEFVNAATQRLLTRPATQSELNLFGPLLAEGFNSRIVPGDQPIRRSAPPRNTGVSWSNHLKPEANLRKQRLAEELSLGDPTTSRLNADWRERAEDVIWSLINSPEFQLVP